MFNKERLFINQSKIEDYDSSDSDSSFDEDEDIGKEIKLSEDPINCDGSMPSEEILELTKARTKVVLDAKRKIVDYPGLLSSLIQNKIYMLVLGDTNEENFSYKEFSKALGSQRQLWNLQIMSILKVKPGDKKKPKSNYHLAVTDFFLALIKIERFQCLRVASSDLEFKSYRCLTRLTNMKKGFVLSIGQENNSTGFMALCNLNLSNFTALQFSLKYYQDVLHYIFGKKMYEVETSEREFPVLFSMDSMLEGVEDKISGGRYMYGALCCVKNTSLVETDGIREDMKLAYPIVLSSAGRKYLREKMFKSASRRNN